MTDTETKIEIRQAKESDAEKISDIIYRAFMEFKPLYTEKAFQATVITPAEILKRMNEGPILLVLCKNQTVGTISFVFKTEGCYLRGMAVVPEARGAKAGLQLLTAVENLTVQQQAKRRLFLCTTPFLSSAIRLYSHFGFKRIGNHYSDFFGTPIFSMEKLTTST